MMASAALSLAGCSATSHEPLAPSVAAAPIAAAATTPARPVEPDPDLNRPPPVRHLAIDWSTVALASDADAAAVWQQIAPTGADWDDKLPEIPPAIAHQLAVALLRAGNFTCARPPADDCAKPLYDVPPPAETAGLGDPCLRRLLALWALDFVDEGDLPAIKPALFTIAALPPPESQLVAAAFRAIPELDADTRLELLAQAWRAGQHDLVDASVGSLDEAHLALAVKRHHIGGALEVLSPEASRTTYLVAITDPLLPPRARTLAITELDALAAGEAKLPTDLQTALVTAAAAKDCAVAAAAARVLDQHGDHRFVPRRPRTTSVAPLLRAMCVLASYEALQGSDEPSLLATYLPARGLERTTITYDPLSEVDSDGDGDPHTNRSDELVPQSEAVLPELDDLVRAMQHCTGTVCVSDDHEFHFVWKASGGALLLTRIELAERPPCVTPATRTP
jgi:hypothetical protein